MLRIVRSSVASTALARGGQQLRSCGPAAMVLLPATAVAMRLIASTAGTAGAPSASGLAAGGSARGITMKKKKKKKIAAPGPIPAVAAPVVADTITAPSPPPAAGSSSSRGTIGVSNPEQRVDDRQVEPAVPVPAAVAAAPAASKTPAAVAAAPAAKASVAPAKAPATEAPAPMEPTAETPRKKTALVKSFKLDDVSSLCKASDAIFARRLASGGCQFFAWPGTPLSVAAAAITTMPDTLRTVHSVFGREGTPVDLVMDIDCLVPEDHWTTVKAHQFQHKILDDTLKVVHAELEQRGETVKSQVVLQSPNMKKVSFHVHTKLEGAAFDDYRSILGLLAPLHAEIPYVDLQIYRSHGMLRMHSCMKENHTSPMQICGQEESSAGGASGRAHVATRKPTRSSCQWNIKQGKRYAYFSEEEAALHSVCVREPGTFSRLVSIAPPRGSFVEITHQTGAGVGAAYAGGGSGAGYGSGAPGSPSGAPVRFVPLPRTEREAIDNVCMWLRNCSEVDVLEWRSWIGMGINAFRVAYHFRNSTKTDRPPMEMVLEAWIDGSKKCPQKYRLGDCESKWNTFDIGKLSRESDWWQAYQSLGKLQRAR